RSAARRWKTGFYWIAVEAGVPVVLGFLDYAQKRGGLAELLHPTGDIAADFELLRRFYRDVKGKFPERQGEISLGDAVPPPVATACVRGARAACRRGTSRARPRSPAPRAAASARAPHRAARGGRPRAL